MCQRQTVSHMYFAMCLGAMIQSSETVSLAHKKSAKRHILGALWNSCDLIDPSFFLKLILNGTMAAPIVHACIYKDPCTTNLQTRNEHNIFSYDVCSALAKN